MTDRLPSPLEAVGLFTGKTKNVVMVGGEGAGKTSNTNTVVVRMVCAKKVKRVSVISPALSISSPKTDWDWLSHVAGTLCEFIGVAELTDDPIANYNILERTQAPCIDGMAVTVTDDLGAKFTTIMAMLPEGKLVTLARYMFMKSCETSSKNNMMITLLQSAISGNQDFKAMYRGHKHRIFYSTVLQDEFKVLSQDYTSFAPGLKAAYAALRMNPEPHTVTIQVGTTSVKLDIPELENRFVYFNGPKGKAHYMYYWEMNGMGMRQIEKPVVNLPILDQAGVLEVISRYGLTRPDDAPVMFQKASGANMVLDIDELLGGTDAAFAAKPTQGQQTSSDVSHGSGNRFQPSYHCCKHP